MSFLPFSTSSFEITTTTTPEGPMFFWAPAYTRPNLPMSNGLQRKSLDMSATSGTEAVSGKGRELRALNSTPWIVSFEVIWQ